MTKCTTSSSYGKGTVQRNVSFGKTGGVGITGTAKKLNVNGPKTKNPNPDF